MKNLFRALVAGTLLFSIAACNKNEGLISIQSHDKDTMMNIMHQMMNQMHAMKMTHDPEIDFANMMIMHHQGAINMAKAELQQGKDDSLKRIAQKIINEQKAEITEFKDYLATQSVDNSVAEFTTALKNNMAEMDKTADIQLITGDIDNDFATLMIVHHQSAINNSQAYLQYGNDPELMKMAKKIISAQKMEIIELSNWLLANKR